MCNHNLYFGCRIRNQSDAKMTRDNYAEITDASRRNSNIHIQKYFQGMSADKAIEEYWRIIKIRRLKKYEEEIQEFQALISELKNATNNEQILQDFIKEQTIDRIRQEIEYNNTFYVKSQDSEKQQLGKKYAIVLEKNDLLDYSDTVIIDRFNRFQADLNKIKEYDISQMTWIKAPTIWKKWYRENPSEHLTLDIPEEWIKEYFLSNAPYYTDNKCEYLQKQALENYDKNIKYFDSLDSEEFNKEIDAFLKNNPSFVPVYDLREYSGVAGVYIMVLDEYKQIYIGVTRSKLGIKGRIQAHWSNVKPLDRLIFGSVDYSILSIDSFRAYDTTRIYVEPHPEFSKLVLDENGEPKKHSFMGIQCNFWGADEYLLSKEFELIKNSFSQKFLCNRCAGGGTSIENAIGSIKGHDLCDNSKQMLDSTKSNLHTLL